MENMKESGIDWIGKIPNKWITKKSKYVISFVNGYAFNSEDMQQEGKYPIIRIGDIKGGKISLEACLFIDDSKGLELYRVRKNDLLLAMSGATVGKVGISDKDTNAYINQRVGIIRSKVTSYIYYILLTNGFMQYVEWKSIGSAQPNISSSDIGKFSIPVPKEEEQQLIANFLDDKVGKIDNIINNLNKQVEILEKYKKSLITETVTKGLNPNVEMKNSGIDWIGKMPKQWEIYYLKHLFKMYAGGDLDENDFSEEYLEEKPYPIYSNSLENNGLFGYTSKYRFKGRTFTVTGRGDVGKAIVRNNAFYPIVRLLVCIPNYQDDTRYFSYCVNSADLLGEQTAMAQLTTQKLGIVKVPRPLIKEQKEIADYLDKKCAQIDEIIKDKQTQIDKMEKYKKSLIYEYVTGKKRVEGAEELYV